MRKIEYTKRRRYYYHITGRNWGKKVVLKPKEDGINRPYHEPDIARICVAGTVAGCYSAVGCLASDRMRVYRTTRQVKAVKPWRVADAHVTGEAWLFEPTQFKLVATIEDAKVNQAIEDLDNVGTGSKRILRTQTIVRRKLATYFNKYKLIPKPRKSRRDAARGVRH